MPIFRVKSAKIYTSQKKFTRVYPWLLWQIWGMRLPLVSGVCSGVCVAIFFWCNVRAVNKQLRMHTQTSIQIHTDAHTIWINTHKCKCTQVQMYLYGSRGQKLVSVARFFEQSAFDPTVQYHWPLPRGNTCVILTSPMMMSRRIRTWTSIFNNDLNINNIKPLSSGSICVILTSPMMIRRRRSTRTWTSATNNHCPEKYMRHLDQSLDGEKHHQSSSWSLLLSNLKLSSG